MTQTRGEASDWQLVRRLFDEAIARPAGQREAWLAALTLEAGVRGELQSLLAHHLDETGGDPLLQAPAGAGLLAGMSREGERFGPWEIVRPIGAGGMGEVFQARRADGSFEGLSAIKVLKRGMDSAAVLERFSRERHALGRLEHPNIARMMDAGLSTDGLPYFVMEHVAGVPIDEAARALPLEGRLTLFLQLADAVAYAHRQLLVHRDLKPGNVLVTPQGQVKLLDFGIAKALDPADTADADTTIGAARPFTPRYASPEQVRGEPVGTATDIYSLGFLLYVMLTGVRPTGRGASTAGEAARAVLEEEPTRPSTLPDDIVADPSWATTRRRLAGDLDNILLKALEKDAGRRYASVDALADDVRRFLAGHPVSAHRASGLYVAGKFVRRHRAAVAAGVAGVLALALGLAATAWQAHQARIARDEAQLRLADIRSITRELVARFGDAVTYLPGGMKLKADLLQQTLQSLDRVAKSSDRDPALIADVAMTYARLAEMQGNDQQLSLGQPDAARVNAEKAIALAQEVLPARRTDWQLAHWTARAHDIRAKVLRGQGQAAQGLQEIDAAAAVLQAVDLSAADAMARASIPSEQAGLLIMRAQLTEQLARKSQAPAGDALAAFDKASAVITGLEAQRPLLDKLDLMGRPEEPKSYAQMLSLQAVVHGGKARIHQRLKDMDAALAQARDAVRYARASVDYDPRQTVWKDTLAVESDNLASVLIEVGRFADAVPVAQSAVDTARTLLQQDGAQSRWRVSLPKLQARSARALAGAGRCADALPAFDDAIARWDTILKSAPAPSAQVAADIAGLRTAALQDRGRCTPGR